MIIFHEIINLQNFEFNTFDNLSPNMDKIPSLSFLHILIDIMEKEPSKKSLVAAKKFFRTTSQGFFLSFWYFRTCAWNDVGQQRNFVLKPLKQPHTAFQKKITHKNKEKKIFQINRNCVITFFNLLMQLFPNLNITNGWKITLKFGSL